ncbi:MAG: histidinol dehydrogenase [Pseudomonadota bacterium]
MAVMRRLNSASEGFDDSLKLLAVPMDDPDGSVIEAVHHILRDVRKRGDPAVLDYTERYDRFEAESFAELEVQKSERVDALASLSKQQRDALTCAAKRIGDFHERQLSRDWNYTDEHGNQFGQRVTPLERVGVYVPGGKASYPSSVLMNSIPARVAGVREIVMVAPTPDRERNPLVLAAAELAGVDRLFTIGGAQAVGALAFGTDSIPRVDKIVGPGNKYVAEAKRQVFGQVAIDMIAGPSEILIIADGSAHPDWMAMDLFSQAEHDENAQAILLSHDEEYLNQVEASVEKLLPTLERSEVIKAALDRRGALVQVRDLEDAARVSNLLAPEHLELAVKDPEDLVEKITSAGAIFMGIQSCEALGDYCAGPNHVLPTSGTARFFSPLGVYDFQKKSSIIRCTESGAEPLARVASILARGESLTAHARSAEYRIRRC